MSELAKKLPRANPFWSYRDPLTGRWLTLMTPAQWQQAESHRPFAPRACDRPQVHDRPDSHRSFLS